MRISRSLMLPALVLLAACGGAAATADGDAGDTPDAPAEQTTDGTTAASTSDGATTANGEDAGADTTADSGADDDTAGDRPDDLSGTAEDATSGASSDFEFTMTPAEEAAADTPAARLLTGIFPAGFEPPTEDQARCVGGETVAGLGDERVAALDLEPGMSTEELLARLDLTDDEIDIAVDSLFECVDVAGMFASDFEPQYGAEAAQCIAGYLDDALIKELAGQFLAGEAIDGALFIERIQTATAECGAGT